MDHRRFYVIGAATGEHGPFSLEELAAAARAGEVAESDQVRTALGTRVRHGRQRARRLGRTAAGGRP